MCYAVIKVILAEMRAQKRDAATCGGFFPAWSSPSSSIFVPLELRFPWNDLLYSICFVSLSVFQPSGKAIDAFFF